MGSLNSLDWPRRWARVWYHTPPCESGPPPPPPPTGSVSSVKVASLDARPICSNEAWPASLRHTLNAVPLATLAFQSILIAPLLSSVAVRLVGVAGGAQKCGIVVDEYGFDACVDYKAGRLYADLRAATPDGIDGYFDNVGGETLDAVLRRMNAFGRVAVCGLIAGYDGQPLPINEFRSVLINRLKVQGFIVSEHPQYWPPAQRQLAELVGSGQMKYRETVAQGLDAAPEAFIGLLKGRNFGKQLVRLVEAA